MLPTSQENDPISLDSIRDVLKQAATCMQQKQPKTDEAIKLYDEVIETLQDASNDKDEAARHLLAATWMNKSNVLLSIPNKDQSEDVQKGFQEAIRLFGTLPIKTKELYVSDAVTLWSSIGQAQIKSNKPNNTEDAIGCFERAIHLLQLLPWQGNLQLRAHLIGLWFNIGNAQRLFQGTTRRNAAINAYTHAIVFSQDFPIENPQSALLISNVWMNRASLFSSAQDEEQRKEALFSFEKSIEILKKVGADKDPNIALHIARAQANRAKLLSLPKDKANTNASAIAEAAAEAKKLSEAFIDQAPMAAENVLNARLALCQNYCLRLQESKSDESLNLYEQATDEIDEALSLIHKCEAKGAKLFRPIARQFFRVGTQLYRSQQPHFLAEFITDSVGTGRPLNDDPAIVKIARECIDETIENLTKNNPVTAGSPEAEQLNATLNPLKKILESLPKEEAPESK